MTEIPAAIPLHVRTAGAGPALALVHGWGLHGGVWERTMADLAGSYSVAALDLPGHGYSPAAPADLGQWAAQLGDALPGSRVWVGWSLGGLVCLQLAVARPAQVRALVLVAATPRFTAAADWPWAVDERVLDDFAGELRRDRGATLARFLALQVRGSTGAQASLRQMREALAQGPEPADLDAGLTLLRSADLRGELDRIRCPVWLVRGERDTLVSAQAVDAAAARLRQATVETLPGAGHAPFMARPEAFAAGLRAFLASIDPEAAPDVRRGSS